MKTTPLHPRFGLTVHDVDLCEVTADHLFPDIRQAFETHSALLFPAQCMSDADHTRLAELFGPLENREAMASGRDVAFEVSAVSNETEKGVTDPEALHTQNLKANMLWHTDSTFLPVPALVNILTARVVPTSGGETELAAQHLMTRWPDRPWRAVWPNPVTGEEALFIASHAFSIEGLGHEDGRRLIDEAIAFCTRPEYVYTHRWQVGDVLLWDERATLHRGRPWPYEEPRSLKSICCSVTGADGLESVRIV